MPLSEKPDTVAQRKTRTSVADMKQPPGNDEKKGFNWI